MGENELPGIRVANESTGVQPEPKGDRVDRLLKVLAVVIAAGALLSSVGSAAAAWFSWRTAKSAEQVAQSTLDTAGAKLVVDPTVMLIGYCDSVDQPLHAVVRITNDGRTATRITNLSLSFRVDGEAYPKTGPPIPTRTYTPLGFTSTATTINGQDGQDFDMLLDCELLKDNGVPFGVNGWVQGPLAELVDRRPGAISILFDSPLIGANIVEVEQFGFSARPPK